MGLMQRVGPIGKPKFQRSSLDVRKLENDFTIGS
jgi:hypothetical protein